MVTIIMPVSRDYYLQRIFAQLELLECDASETNLLTYVDGDLELFQKTRNFTVNSKFRERLSVYRKRGVPNVGSIKRRRQRIADIHNEMKDIIDSCDYIFMIEDDTLIPTNALNNLLIDYADYPQAGFISGVQIGRWGYKHIGAWTVDDIYFPNKVTSIKDGQETIEVDASGFYCCLVKRDIYHSHVFKPFQDILGPDVDFGIEIRKLGYKNYVDYQIKCKHLTKHGEISFLNSDVMQVEFNRENDKWLMKEV